ncbi:FtsJ-domain-containing protein [Sphaerulina musiva SO2202]|uniref:rRNA methyltransferase 2, mitochondrial n=1 Tax=Sphaerulina musiva (strain SO2202) TaxID=692275 RepID=M3D4C8_SPHMS|nr:FtsJ-domain-containing protein [Sphaerulina musiva SO2202]EMF12744.1 FtsJ-domain-containing protein [Sphaerulina musiva SO2202]
MLARTVGQIPCAAIAKRQLACERAWGSCIIAPGLPVRRQWSGQLEHQQRRPLLVLLLQNRYASSSSSTRWKSRQGRDSYAREAKVAGLKSRAAFKLLEINEKYKLFRMGDTVVDLGFAPGSWSQVAVNRTSPGGRVVGIDIIPAQPPRGANALQGNFLSAEIREEVRKFVSDPDRGRVRSRTIVEDDVTEEDLQQEHQGIVQLEMHAAQNEKKLKEIPKADMTQKQLDLAEGRVVNVVLSDMLMNTSGIAARDHGGSMDLCMAALTFCFDTLSTGGNFICKFYTGAEDHAMEMRLKKLFEKVHRIKPDSTRKESKEAYFVGLRRKAGAKRAEVLEDG